MTRRLALLVERALAYLGLAAMSMCGHHWHRDHAPRGWNVPYWRCCWCGGEQIGRPPAEGGRTDCRAPAAA